MIKKVLVANRGEIAIRVIRACKELNIKVATVYSDVDRNSLHVRFADEAYYIGKPQPTESYLRIDKIINVAKESMADAIHPGYGFLAENEYFADACEKEGIIFIGPPSHAIKLLGDKVEARKTMRNAGIPIIPGSIAPVDVEEAYKIAEEIGFPILIKAAGGGGGKGMRIVKSKEELPEALKMASMEAQSAFDNPSVYIEKYLETPRHIEFQVLADNYGNVIHLFERECSVQRRYQKLIEEAPSCAMTEDLRKKMGDVAVKAVKAACYTNAGTVEFMVDKNRNFYFLEMNTRLQVEHPVTELITGIDIVKEQLKIASGEKLSINQEDVKIRGNAIECRICAEDPNNNFIPSTGKIEEVIEPSGPGVRVDSCLFSGLEIPVYYDPLIAKLLVWAPTREEAISRMLRALNEYKIVGVKTNISFHQLLLSSEEFLSGNYNTSLVEKVLQVKQKESGNEEIAAICGVIAKLMNEKKEKVSINTSFRSGWKSFSRQYSLRWRI